MAFASLNLPSIKLYFKNKANTIKAITIGIHNFKKIGEPHFSFYDAKLSLNPILIKKYLSDSLNTIFLDENIVYPKSRLNKIVSSLALAIQKDNVLISEFKF